MNQHQHKPSKVQPLVAMRSMARLVQNPQATDEVFVIIRALSGDAVNRGYQRFAATAHAKEILNSEKSLLDVLADRDSLRDLPMGSLGQSYLAFMEAGNITAEGLKEASEVSDAHSEYIEPNLRTYALRLRDQHDLWHVLTGFGRDVAGEACLLAFTYAQTGNRGIGFIGLVGAIKLRGVFGRRFFSSMWQAYQMGRRTQWLPGQPWEQLLSTPLQQVREDLGVTEPDRYTSLPLELVSG